MVFDSMAKRILVFDDSPIDLMLVESMLLEAKFDVTACNSVDAARDVLCRPGISMLITDLFVTDPPDKRERATKGGLSLISVIQTAFNQHSYPWLKTLPILAVTASPSTKSFDALVQARAVGATAGLRKPFKRAELLKAVDDLIRANEPSSDQVAWSAGGFTGR